LQRQQEAYQQQQPTQPVLLTQQPMQPVPPPQQLAQQQQRPLHSDSNEYRGYMMLPDKRGGYLTVLDARNEFTRPVVRAKLDDRSWPFTSKRKKVCQRRRDFFALLEKEAVEHGLGMDVFVDRFSRQRHRQTTNSIFKELKDNANAKKKASDEADVMQGGAPDTEDMEHVEDVEDVEGTEDLEGTEDMEE
ncbi:hypothetical protein BGZ99_009732, partial [Dissophora globulifera]